MPREIFLLRPYASCRRLPASILAIFGATVELRITRDESVEIKLLIVKLSGVPVANMCGGDIWRRSCFIEIGRTTLSAE